MRSCTLRGDVGLILFGGSGSEIEVRKVLKRHYISAEIDERYYKMILDRLKEGKIEVKYRLRMKKYDVKNTQAQLALLEEQKEYLANKE